MPQQIILKKIATGHYAIDTTLTAFKPGQTYTLAAIDLSVDIIHLTIPSTLPANCWLDLQFQQAIELSGDLPPYSKVMANKIHVNGNIGHCSQLKSSQDIHVDGNVGRHSQLESSQDIHITGHAGLDAHLTGNNIQINKDAEAITAKAIGGVIIIEGTLKSQIERANTNNHGAIKTYSVATLSGQRNDIKKAEGVYSWNGKNITPQVAAQRKRPLLEQQEASAKQFRIEEAATLEEDTDEAFAKQPELGLEEDADEAFAKELEQALKKDTDEAFAKQPELDLEEDADEAFAKELEKHLDLEDAADEEFAKELEEHLDLESDSDEMLNSLPTLQPFHCPPNYSTQFQRGLKKLHGQLAGTIDCSDSLRPHQRKALIEHVNSLMAGGQAGKDQRHAVHHAATGAGKSVIFCMLMGALVDPQFRQPGELPSKALIIVPRINLKKQIANTLKTWAPRITVGDSSEHSAEVIIATYPELKLKLTDIQKNNAQVTNAKGEWVSFFDLFDHVVFDEAHNACAAGGVKLFNHIVATVKKRTGTVMACTATPTYNLNRTEKKQEDQLAVSSVFELANVLNDNPITPFSIKTAIKAGALAPVKTCVFTPTLNLSTTKLLDKLSGGTNSKTDIQENIVSRVIDNDTFNLAILHMFVNSTDPQTGKRLFEEQCAIFCAGVNHTENIVHLFNTRIPADHPLVIRAREEYVFSEREHYTRKKKLHLFDEAKTRAQFKIAIAIHSGQYSVRFMSEQIGAVLTAGQFTYSHNGVIHTHTLSDSEKIKLNTAKTKNNGCTIKVGEFLSKKEREKLIKFYKRKGCKIIAGADILTEGFDHLHTNVIVNARPTKSQVMKAQSGGRGLRFNPNINPNKTAYIIDVNWGIRGQIFFREFLGAMQLGNFPASVARDVIPNIPIEHKGDGELVWEEEPFLRVAPAACVQGKRTSRAKEPQGKYARKETDLDVTIEHLFERLKSLEPTVKQLNSRVGSHISTRALTPSATAAAAAAVGSSSSPTRSQAEAKDDLPNPIHFVNTTTTFTRSSLLKMKLLQKYAGNINTQLESVIATITAAAGEEVRQKTQRKPNTGSQSSNSSMGLWHTHAGAEDISQELQSTLRQLTSLQNKLNQIISGDWTTARSNASAGGGNGNIEMDNVDIETLKFQCNQIADELEKLPVQIQVDVIADKVKQIQQIKKEREQAAKLLMVPPVSPKLPLPPLPVAAAAVTTPLPKPVVNDRVVMKKVKQAIDENNEKDFIEAIGQLTDINMDVLPLHPKRFKILHCLAPRSTLNNLTRLLLQHPAINIDSLTETGYTALHLTALYGNDQIADLLIAKGAKIHLVNIYNNSALSLAIVGSSDCHLKIVRMLIDKGADVTTKYLNGLTPLELAENTSLIKKYRKSLEQFCKSKNIPLPLYSPTAQQEMLRLLEAAEAKLKARATTQAAIAKEVMQAIDENDEQAFRAVIHKLTDINMNVAPTGGDTILHVLAKYSARNHLTNLLLQHPAINIDSLTEQGYTALHLTALYGNDQIADLLIAKGAKIHLVNIYNNSALSLAIVGSSDCHLKIVRMLIDKGADVTTKHLNGLTPLELAENTSLIKKCRESFEQRCHISLPPYSPTAQQEMIRLLKAAEAEAKLKAQATAQAAASVAPMAAADQIQQITATLAATMATAHAQRPALSLAGNSAVSITQQSIFSTTATAQQPAAETDAMSPAFDNSLQTPMAQP